MTFSFRGALADAAILWRTDRDLMWPIAGVFLFLPVLGFLSLASGIELPKSGDREQVREVINTFLIANLVWMALIMAVSRFGELAVLNLCLQRGGTVGALLSASLRRLVPFFLIAVLANALVQLGMYLLVVPAIYVVGRTWMMGVAYAAEPAQGAWKAIARGFALSDRNGWKLGFFAVGLVLLGFAALFALTLAISLIVSLLGAQAARAVILVPLALAISGAWLYLTLVRIAVYRRLGGSINGM